MYKSLLIFIFLFNTAIAYSQIQIGSSESSAMNNAGKLSKEDFEIFKKTTTVFTLQTADYQHLEDFEKAIKKVWTVTPFIIVTQDKISQYMRGSKYSFGTFDGFATQHQGTATTTNTHLSYDIWMPRKKDGEIKGQNIYARIALHCDFNTYMESGKLFNTSNKKKANSSFVKFLYNEAVFYNWSPGFLTGSLQVVNQGLSSEKMRATFSGTKNKALLSALKNDTLFVPEYVNIHFNMFNGNEKMEEEKEINNSKNDFPFIVKYMDTRELSNKILYSEKPIYYLLYVKSSTDKFVSVYSSDGTELYADYTPISYNFKNKDFKSVARAID